MLTRFSWRFAVVDRIEKLGGVTRTCLLLAYEAPAHVVEAETFFVSARLLITALDLRFVLYT